MKTIAIIEDDEYISGLLTEALTDEGYAAVQAYSGTEAMMLLERKRPDLILMDLMLPGISGENLLPHCKGIPVIVVSAKAAVDDKVKLLLDGASLSRIFNNIINNAIKYSDGDFAAVLTEDGTITFSNTSQALDPVMTARLFDRFYTVETARDSTGLGLSIAKLLTERSGGSITAEYREGKLWITLRFAEKETG